MTNFCNKSAWIIKIVTWEFRNSLFGCMHAVYHVQFHHQYDDFHYESCRQSPPRGNYHRYNHHDYHDGCLDNHDHHDNHYDDDPRDESYRQSRSPPKLPTHSPLTVPAPDHSNIKMLFTMIIIIMISMMIMMVTSMIMMMMKVMLLMW